MGLDVTRLAAALGAESEVVFAYLFGSQSTGKTGPRSDVDIAVYLRDGVDAFETGLRLTGVLEKALGTDAIDLVVLNFAPLSLSGRILTTRRVLVDNQPHQRHLFESLTARQFVDFRFREHRLLDMMTAPGVK